LKGARPRIRRQHPIGRYVADFYCAAAKLIIEVDGDHHDFGDRPVRDEERQRWLEQSGLTVIRVRARDVLRNPDEIADSILRLCQTPPPSPLPR
jgi:very-short-patch-repair endonuclease